MDHAQAKRLLKVCSQFALVALWIKGWRPKPAQLGQQAGRRFRQPGSCPSSVEPSHGMKAGIAVFHNKFGEGKVLAVEGQATMHAPRVSFDVTAPSGWRCRLPS